MTRNRSDPPGRGGTCKATNSVVRQGKTSRYRHRCERPVGNPLVAGSSPARPTHLQLSCGSRVANLQRYGAAVAPATAQTIWPKQGLVFSHLADSTQDPHEGQGGGQAAAEFGLDGARIEQHRVPDTVIAVGGELIENLVGCSAEQALPNQRQR